MNNYKSKSFYFSVLIIMASLNISQSKLFAQSEDIVDEIELSLLQDVLEVWYPKVIDSIYGGYLSDFDYKWQEQGRQNKMLVSQTRHVWTTSKMYEFFQNEKYKNWARHGFEFLRSNMWDNKNGGFYFLRNQEGDEISFSGTNKTAYSNSFALYSLAAYYKISNDKSALDLAIETFRWLEDNSHDPINKGYFDLLKNSNNASRQNNRNFGLRLPIDNSWKDQNSSIHLLEAFTELYSVWPDSLLRERTLEMLHLIRDVITTEKGYLTLYMTEDWKPISFRDSSKEMREANHHLDHVSFGHDVETAFLMLEASHILKIKNDAKTLLIAKKMVDHSLMNGWDNVKGGFYYEGYYFNDKEKISIINPVKTWWVQAEGLNSLLMMSKLYPEEKIYYESFLKQWDYIKKYLIDKKYKGWYTEGLDRSPNMVNMPKGYDWKVNYHNVRALMNCIKMLRAN